MTDVAAIGTRAAKNDLHDAFAQVGKALANGHRIELLDLVAQGDRSVEVLAARADISVALASAHLQALRRAGLVASRRDGNRILYRLADDDVYALLASVRTVASRLGEAERAAARFLGAPREAVSRSELVSRVRAGEAVVVDLRPADEFAAGHIAGALCRSRCPSSRPALPSYPTTSRSSRTAAAPTAP